jgi:hypothetical protein
MSLLDITENDIQALSDVDLRTLIGRLCEAELELNGQPVTAAMWGGDQRAADGGLDVLVALEKPLKLVGELPRWKIGFQVKQESMSRGKIISEMAPQGEPRPILFELAKDGGAYIIACGRDSTSDSMRTSRLEGMQEVCDKVQGADRLHIDFFDSNRIASWTRKHPGLILWVRETVGRPIVGWQPYQDWANCPGGVDDEYLLDDSSKLRDGVGGRHSELTAEDGLNMVRTILANERESLRIAGLSGVGKTRFVQALFDPRVGKYTIAQTSVCYTDMAGEPVPTPIEMAYQLVALKKRAVLIVDNCPPDLHGKLTEICKRAESRLSLLSVEYDIKEDLPENTEVFYMEPSSSDLLVKLIIQRFDSISWNEAERIAEFSEGNARIALAIAGTVKRGESVLSLKSGELFKRLFWQRNDPDQNLLKAAEVCSIVYSFNGEDMSPDGELARLGALVGLTAVELFRHVGTLFKRGLLQKRSRWRAVLPQAISNRLAKQALDNIPIELVEAKLNEDQSGRLIKSFANRLGYVHDSSVAVGVVRKWLSAEGWLGRIKTLSSTGMKIFKNIAPVSPALTLESIEHAANGEDGELFTSRKNSNCREFVRLLRRLAYDPGLFERCCDLLLRFALAERPDESSDSAQTVLSSLFYIHYSGTHAPLEQRLTIIQNCAADDSPYNWIVPRLLEATLRSSYFRTHFEFKFGAHPRDYGSHPETEEEIREWYLTALLKAQELGTSDLRIAPLVREVLANCFRGLWWNVDIREELVRCAEAIASKVYWEEGWVAVRTLLGFDKERLKEDEKAILNSLEQRLSPLDLYQQVRAYALVGNRFRFDLADEEEDDGATNGYERVAKKTEHLGELLANDHFVFEALLPDLLSKDSNRLLSLGVGIGKGAKDFDKTWSKMKEGLSIISMEERSLLVMLGFLIGVEGQDAGWVARTLDKAVDCDILSVHFPALQCGMHVDKSGAKRILKSLEHAYIPARKYECLFYSSKKFDDSVLAKLLLKIADKDGGLYVALHILSARIDFKKQQPIDEALIGIGQQLSHRMLREKDYGSMEEYYLDETIQACFSGPEAKEEARKYCQELCDAVDEGIRYEFNSRHLVNPLIKVQPQVVLDELLLTRENGSRFFSVYHGSSEITLKFAPVDSVIEWCEVAPEERYPLVVQVAPLFYSSNLQDSVQLSPLAEAIMEHAPDDVAVIQGFGTWVQPSSWSGSLAAAMSKRVPFIEGFFSHEKKSVRDWAEHTLKELKSEIERRRKREEERDRDRYESFE